MAFPIPINGLYPSIEDVNKAVRVLVNDTFAGVNNVTGEGRVYVDTWTPNITIINQAMQHLQRDLETEGVPTTQEVTFIIASPVTPATLTLTGAAAAVGGNTAYAGTITGGGSNALVGQYFTIAGFANAGNNVATALCVASTALLLTLANPNGVLESKAATATAVTNAITPVNGPLGLAVADPSVQVYLSFNGYWDGSVLHENPILPPDLLVPLKVQQRISGSTGNAAIFQTVAEAPDGLASNLQTAQGLGGWEWRTDKLNFNGALVNMDIELRYAGGVSPFPTSLSVSNYCTTLIPFLDSTEAMSYRCAYIFCRPRLPAGDTRAQELQANYEYAVQGMANRWRKTQQRSPLSRREFGNTGAMPPGGAGPVR